jgi:hypothetical protein
MDASVTTSERSNAAMAAAMRSPVTSVEPKAPSNCATYPGRAASLRTSSGTI